MNDSLVVSISCVFCNYEKYIDERSKGF